ncbi:hypothetical protein ACV3TT_04915 [Clostridium perfringens]
MISISFIPLSTSLVFEGLVTQSIPLTSSTTVLTSLAICLESSTVSSDM